MELAVSFIEIAAAAAVAECQQSELKRQRQFREQFNFHLMAEILMRPA